jgi:ADP-ribosylglycohydrolase
MLGALAGDIIGSCFIQRPVKTTTFPIFADEAHFTAATVMNMAVAQAIVDDRNYGSMLREYGQRYPDAGYDDAFYNWVFAEKPQPGNNTSSCAAMRAVPIGWAFNTSGDVLREAQRSAISHASQEGVFGAQAVALAVYLARTGTSRDDIRREIEHRFGYDLSQRVAAIRLKSPGSDTCSQVVPPAICAFLEATNVEDAIRKAISLGGASSIQASIAGGIAEAYFKSVGNYVGRETRSRLPEGFIDVYEDFCKRFDIVDDDRAISSIW